MDTDAGSSHRIGVERVPQTRTRWCWAAVSVSMRHFLRSDLPRITECKLAEIRLGHTQQHDCCTPPPIESCNVENFLERALHDAGVEVRVHSGVLFFPDVRDELSANRPICVRIDFSPPNLDHFVQLDGFEEGNPPMYIVNDPQRGELRMSESDFRTNYNNERGAWQATYLLG
jgi:hypothetical protein